MSRNEKFKILDENPGDLSTNELIKLSKLFKRVFKKNFSHEFLNWFYNKNPNGSALTYNASYNNEVVGHYALIPIKINLKGKEHDAALSVFTAIDKKYRGLYLFNKLAKKTFEMAKNKGIKYIIGVSNQISTKLFIRYFKFKLISKLDVKFGIGNIKKVEKENNFKVIWNNESLSWRLKNPRFNYQIHELKQNFLIYNNFYKFFKIQMGEFSKINFLNTFENHMNKSRFRFFNLWIGLGDYDWKNSLYFNFPEILKPAPLNFIIKNVSNETDDLNLEKSDIEFQLIDFDIF